MEFLSFFKGMSGLELVFAIAAAAGGLVTILRLLLLAFGIGFDDFDLDVDVDADGGSGFTGFSVSGLGAFFLMFGLSGLAMYRGGLHTGLAIALSVGVGVVTIWLNSQIFRFFVRMQSRGNIETDSAVGEEGTVYLSIPAGGVGKIQVVVQKRLRVYDARSDADEQIETGDRIRVVRVVDGNVFVVEKLLG